MPPRKQQLSKALPSHRLRVFTPLPHRRRNKIMRDVPHAAPLPSHNGPVKHTLQKRLGTRLAVRAVGRVSTDRVLDVLDVRAHLAEPLDQLVGVLDPADQVAVGLVDEQGHLRDAVVAHDAVRVDDLLGGRVLQKVGKAADEVLGQVLAEEGLDGLAERVVPGRQEGGRVVLARGVEARDDVFLDLGELRG